MRVAYFTAEQVDAILRNASPHFATAFRALLGTGCRPGELTKLTASDVEQSEGELFWIINHKNQRHTGGKRRVYLTDEVQQITRGLLEQFPRGRLFRSGDLANPDGELSETYLSHSLREICRKPECRSLGLDDYKLAQRCDGTPTKLYKYVPYTTRHTFAVRYLTGFYKDAAGQPIILGYPEIAQYLGNSASVVEKIYGHLVTQKKFLALACAVYPWVRSPVNGRSGVEHDLTSTPCRLSRLNAADELFPGRVLPTTVRRSIQLFA